MYWATYKAVVRRDGGPFRGARGESNFNLDLIGPILDGMTITWDAIFNRQAPEQLAAFAELVLDRLTRFLEEFVAGCGELGLDEEAMRGVGGQVAVNEKHRLQEGVNKVSDY
jgi:hypothetical protein